jgi:hypothetical protein
MRLLIIEFNAESYFIYSGQSRSIENRMIRKILRKPTNCGILLTI